jgi:CHAD domain-containing protein
MVEAIMLTQRANLQAARKSKTPEDPRSIHTLRIAAKKLRYTIEAAKPG